MSNRTEYVVTPLVEVDRGHWTPTVGPEMVEFLDRVVLPDSQESVLASTISILAQGISPNVEGGGQATGLVIGYVQSGKTMSFEAVAALARDNCFPLVIIIAGTSNPLLEQSTKRLRRDLGLDKLDRERRWRHFRNPRIDDSNALRDTLAGWSDPNTPARYKQTALVTVLKHHKRLQDLSQILERLDMQRTPTLVIDDEADQASLNTGAKRGEFSTTYNRLMSLRATLPFHTYLQYTATPQAPLLISIIDSLSPDFVHVLYPGNSYIGGSQFFGNDHRYLRSIPSKDIPHKNEALNEPPESLLEALRVFMVGVAIGLESGNGKGNRSMLLHPSHLTLHHHEYFNWVRQVFDNWKNVLALPNESDPDRVELLADFESAYADLQKTIACIPRFKSVARSLPLAFRNTQVLEINTRKGQTPPVDWTSTYGCILVGGQAMDRGFTVEGLTVTYMPRGIGVGNADTIQQRGRFFGYKKVYVDYCRIYLDDEMIAAFKNYVAHEEFMRNQLIDFEKGQRPLHEWKRLFVLDQALRPCRQHVLEFDYDREKFSDSWVFPEMVGGSKLIVRSNRQVVDDYLSGINMNDDSGHPHRTSTQRHQVCRNIPLKNVLERLLLQIRVTEARDSQKNTMLLLKLSQILELNPEELCSVFLMSGGNRRKRAVDRSGKIKQLFQGQFPVTPKSRRGEIYGGDREIIDKHELTLQIHNLELEQADGGRILDVKVVAVWVPRRFAVDWFYQHQAESAP